MRNLSLLTVTNIGSMSRLLRNTAAGHYKFSNEQGDTTNCTCGFLEGVLEQLDDFGFNITKNSYQADLLRNKVKEFKKSKPGEFFTEEEAKEFLEVYEGFIAILNAEIFSKKIFMTTEKRIDVHKLLEDVGGLMHAGVFAKLPEISRADFEEAGKCIAYERATAAAFHILRGTEGVLKHYYLSKVKRGRTNRLMWGDMLNSMRSKKKSPSALILNHLESIKDDFRNPTAHPEKVYNIDEVQDLFSRCIDVVNRMIKDI